MEMLKDLPIILYKTEEEWRNWLTTEHTQSSGVWVKIAKKKNSGAHSVTYEEALQIALCFGWIDGLVQKYDEQYYLQKFSPRRSGSTWSKSNIARVEKLIQDNKMQPAGLAAIEKAKQNGQWERAYDSPRNMTIPPDFQKKLDDNPDAKDFFLSLNKTNQFSFLWRIQTAKRIETREARIDTAIAMLREKKTFH